MRYDRPVFFVKEGKKQYDPDLGIWNKGEGVRTKRYANITHMGAQRQQAVFGDVKSNRHIVRLQRAYTQSYDFIEIDGIAYIVDTERCPCDKQSLVVMEDGRNQD